MSKQSEAKSAQGYTTEVRNCKSCAHLTSERVLPRWHQERNAENARTGSPSHYPVEIFGEEKNIRCGIGGFAVKKTATCAKHTPK